jgi:hypothetical protein
MKSDRLKPGNGGASLQYFNTKFHRKLLKNSESCVATSFNNDNHFKFREELAIKKRG